jgi:hypothetical protein
VVNFLSILRALVVTTFEQFILDIQHTTHLDGEQSGHSMRNPRHTLSQAESEKTAKYDAHNAGFDTGFGFASTFNLILLWWQESRDTFIFYDGLENSKRG